jgi:O-antigen/teichoic acid export membrane protein
VDEAPITPSSHTRGHEYRSRRAATNSLIALAGQFVVLAIALVTTPITLSKIGLTEVGIWTLAITAVSYLTVVDPGFGDIVTRYGAQARVRGEENVSARICTLGSLAWIGFGVLVAPLVLLVVPFLAHHLSHLKPSVIPATVSFFYWAFGLLIFGSVLATLSGRLSAIGDQWIVTIVDSTTRIIYAVVLIVLLYRGWHLSAIVMATTAQYALSYVVTFILVWRRDSFPYANPRGLGRNMLRELTRFGGLLQLNSILDTLTFETDSLVLGTLVGVISNGLYSMVLRLARLSNVVASNVQSNILPGISAAYASNEGLVGMRRIYVRANRVVVLLGAYLGGAVIAFAPLMLEAWLGRPLRAASWAMVFVTITMIAGLPRPVTGYAIFAMGKVGLGVRAQAMAFAVNVVLTLALFHPYGLNGVLFGTVVAKIVATGYLLIRFARIAESSVRELILPWLVPIVAVTTLTAALGRLAMRAWPYAVNTRLGSLEALVVLSLGYALLYAVGLRVTKYFHPSDLHWFKNAVPRPIGRLITPKLIRLISGPAS